MKKLVFCFLCIVGVTMFMNSCKSKQTKEAFNDSIQGTFFGVSFGANEDEVIKKFAEQDLMPNVFVSTKESLVFQPYGGKRYTFGGLSWNNLDVCLSNGKFYGIIFYNALKDKAEAIRDGQSLFESVSAKYQMAKEEPKDSATYLLYRGKSKKEPERQVIVLVRRYEGEDNTIYYGAFLVYVDETFETKVNDEL